MSSSTVELLLSIPFAGPSSTSISPSSSSSSSPACTLWSAYSVFFVFVNSLFNRFPMVDRVAFSLSRVLSTSSDFSYNLSSNVSSSFTRRHSSSSSSRICSDRLVIRSLLMSIKALTFVSISRLIFSISRFFFSMSRVRVSFYLSKAFRYAIRASFPPSIWTMPLIDDSIDSHFALFDST